MNANTLSNQNVMQVWIFISWCKCFLQRCKCSYDAHASLPNVDVTFHDANATSLWCKFPMQGCTAYSWWCKCLIVGMSLCKCFFTRRKCNLSKNFFYFSNRGFLGAWNQNAFKTRLIFFEDYSFLFRRGLNAQCIIPAPKTCFILT